MKNISGVIRCEKLKVDAPECQFVRSLYETAFPVDERRDFAEVLRLFGQKRAFDMQVVYADGKPVGLISLWSWAGWRYVEHFAVDSSCRGKGIGAEVLRQLQLADNRPLVLEVEQPVDDLSRRRVEFYKRSGFVLHESFAYVQPPYDAGRRSLPMCLMTWGAAPEADLGQVASMLHREVYGCEP